MPVVPRQRITLALRASLAHGIALIVAPAGYGKTEALLEAFGAIGLVLELPEGQVTVEGLARALLARVSPRSARALTQILQRPSGDERDSFVANWLTVKMRAVDAPIVVDDFQRINAQPAARAFLLRIIEATVPKVRWAIASRETPDLPIGTWLVSDWMRMPTLAGDLAFSLEDARQLAATLDVDIPDAELGAIVENSEGWPLVVRLALSTWEQTRARIPLRIRTNALLFDFMEAQVWSETSSEDQELLFASALLGEVRPGLLASAGFTNAAFRLERLQRRIPLVRQLPAGAYRFHELFREFVLARQTDPQLYSELIERLATSLEENGAHAQALQLATRGSAWPLVTRLLETHGYDLIEGGEHAVIGDVIAAVPRASRKLPIFSALAGIMRSNEGVTAAAEAEMSSVVNDARLPLRLRHQLQLRLAQLAINRGEPHAALAAVTDVLTSANLEDALDGLTVAAASHATLGNAEAALDAIARINNQIEHTRTEVKARILVRVAFALLYLGDYPGAESRALAVVELAEAVGLPALAARAYSVLEFVTNVTHTDTVMELRYAQARASAAKESGEKSTLAHALFAVVTLAAERADDDLYAGTLVELRDIRTSLTPRMNVPLRWARAIHDAGFGNFRDAIVAIRTVDLTDAGEAAKSFCGALEGLLCAAADERERAEELLHRPIIVAATAELESRQQLAYAHAYRALGLWLLGRSKVAQRSLGPAPFNLSERDNAIIGILRSICTSPRATMTHRKLEYLTNPLVGLELHGHARFLRALFRPAIVEATLTRAELEVLRELRRGGTYAEVAHRLGSAPKTIDKHLERASRKLGCSGREATVAIAASRGWLDAADTQG